MRRFFLTAAIFSIVLLSGSRAPARLRGAVVATATQARDRHITIAGYIGDSMCGLKHGHSKTTEAQDRDCTIQCVHDGSRYILADRAARKVYELEDQEAPRPYAGQKVRVTGEIEGDGLRIETIEKEK